MTTRLAFIFLCLSLPLSAQWSDDPAQNLAIASGAGEEVLGKIAVRSDGGVYVGWFHNVGAPNHYEVRLQRLDPSGNPLWAPEGLLVSDQPHESFLVDWDLIADDADHAVLTFTDNRAGNRDVQAYRMDENGVSVWGPLGISLSANTEFEADPRVTQATDGDLVFVWSRSPVSGDGAIMIQRIAPNGTLAFPAGGLIASTETGEAPGFCEVVPSLNGDVIISWLRDFNFSSPVRHIRVQRFNPSGTAVWNGGDPVVLFDQGLPAGYRPRLIEDQQGGAAAAWFFGFSQLNCYTQRVDQNGSLAFPANGVTVSNLASQQRVAPSIAYNSAEDNLFVFWRELNLNQSAWGVYGNKISPTGTREWGDSGIAFLPLGGLPASFVTTLSHNNQAMTFWFQAPSAVSTDAQVKGLAVNSAGNPVWAGSPINVATSLASKDNLEAVLGPNGRALMVWDDDRNGLSDVYGQNVNPDGSLGVEASCPGDCAPPGGDGEVDETDLLTAAAQWPGSGDCDFNGDGQINILDLTGIMSVFGPCPTR